ncbi:MAG TPA: FAD-linked oxidase C-terminal domain-containing protein [Thermodesulfobacteriota bacterium]|nr:FAD-linked oxidase C-terminal domain-containing protein [Thermodesulfobacteriota bacterium]
MALPTDVLGALQNIVGSEGMLASGLDLAAYSFDGTTNWQGMPEVVVFPTTAEHVSAILALANAQAIAVTARGAGTNVSGGSIPTAGGIVLCTTRMNRILEIDAANLTATVEAGVVLNDLNLALSRRRLFFPPDPQSFLAATIGGCVSENAGGPYAVKYGVFKHYLLGMRAVLPSGAILDLGGRTMKNVTGYDLPQLLCGSEGTLAVITQVTMRLLPQPAMRQTVLAVFDQVVKAGEAVHRILASGIIPAKIELMDNWIIRRIEEMMPLGLPTNADAILLFECDGLPETVTKECAAVIDLSRQAGAVSVRAAENAREAENFWTARRAGFSAIFGHAKTVLAEDVTVPITRIPELIDRVRKLSREHNLTIVIIGHAGDGNLHPSILTDKHNIGHLTVAERVMEAIFSAALELGGVVSGEHGIGLEKRRFLKQAMEPEAIALLRSIKNVFDPKGILNPGKIWEDA